MKKIYEVPAMEIVRLDASENIAKLPEVGTVSGAQDTTTNRVTNTVKTTALARALSGIIGSSVE